MGAVPPGQANARLLRVVRGGFAGDFDRDPTAGEAVWEGSEPAYYREQTRRDLVQGGGIIVTRSLIVDSRRPPVEFRTDDTVEFRFKGALHTGKVRETEEKEIPTVPGVVTLRLEEK